MVRQVRKDIVEKYWREVADLVEKGMSVHKAVPTVLQKAGIESDDVYRRSFSRKLAKEGIGEQNKPIEQSDEYKEASQRLLKKSNFYIVTWAQAHSDIHSQFLDNIEAYSQKLGATIIVQAGRYKNPNSLSSSQAQKAKEKNKNIWHPRLQPYLHANRLHLSDKLQALCDVKVQPTAVLPLSGLNGFTADNSCILPHPKVQLQSLPILEGYNHKLMVSTGAVTLPEYTDTKAGKKGEFHHILGFVICELQDDGIFHIRQVQADDDGSFYDLFHHIKDGKVLGMEGEYNIVFGDSHGVNRCKLAHELAVEIANRVQAREIILHDIFDGESINHHEEKDPFRLLEKEESGADNLEYEIDRTIKFVNDLDFQLSGRLNVVASNHNDFLDRWLRNVDWRRASNKKMYLKLANLVASGDAPRGVFSALLESEIPNIRTFGYGESLRIKGWELGLHGDMGTNGSRGSIKQFKNLSTKTISGHTHTPAREDGSIVVGTLTKLRLGYNVGLSSWMQGIVLIYPNGKASNIHFIKGSYTTIK